MFEWMCYKEIEIREYTESLVKMLPIVTATAVISPIHQSSCDFAKLLGIPCIH